MNAISSILSVNPDMSAIDLREMACDVGEAVMVLSGGVRDAHRMAILCENLRKTQAYLILEAAEQAGREAIARDAALVANVAHLARGGMAESPLVVGRDAIRRGRFLRFYNHPSQPNVREALAAYHGCYPLQDDWISHATALLFAGLPADPLEAV